MVSALGIRVNVYFALLFGLGCALAGVAGALAAPVRSLTPGMGLGILVESFIVTVIGGMGSIPGAFLAALLLGMTRSEEHTSELQSLMRISYAVFCLKKTTPE